MNMWHYVVIAFFFFNDTATTEIYTLSLHDALPIFKSMAGVDLLHVPYKGSAPATVAVIAGDVAFIFSTMPAADPKSTRLNSSHSQKSHAGFSLKKKNDRTRAPDAPPRHGASSGRTS